MGRVHDELKVMVTQPEARVMVAMLHVILLHYVYKRRRLKFQMKANGKIRYHSQHGTLMSVCQLGCVVRNVVQILKTNIFSSTS